MAAEARHRVRVGAQVVSNVAREDYAGEALATRLHVRIRRWSAPLGAVVDAALDIPARGPVLDVGSGHGLVALAIARATGRDVLGVDIDREKVAVAGRVAASDPELAGARFQLVDGAWLPSGRWAAVVLADVLYLLEPHRQRAVVMAAAEALVPGGAVLIKETDDRPAWKRRWSSAQEAVAVRTVTRSLSGVQVPPTARQVRSWLGSAGLATSTAELGRGRPWAHYLVVGRRVS